MTESILTKHTRQPKIYVDVPSEFRYCDDQAYTGSSKDVPVFSMTGANEIMMRNPEALLNGKAIEDLIQSCIPSINDAGAMSIIDIEFLLIAIRIATYGEIYKKSSVCPHCRETNSHELELGVYIDSYSRKKFIDKVDIEGLVFHLVPHPYRVSTQIQQLLFQAQRSIAQLSTNTDITEEQRSSLEESINNTLEEINKQNIIDQVLKIETPDGFEDQRDVIKDFILNQDRMFYKRLRDVTVENTKEWDLPKLDLVCGGCGKDYTDFFTMDDSNFFVE
jgi:hypothetical protein